MYNNPNTYPPPPSPYSNMPPSGNVYAPANGITVSVGNPVIMNTGPHVNYLPGPAPRINCMFCQRQTDSICVKRAGRTTFIWCCVLAVTTGCCCIPFCIDQCNDSELLCVVCHQTKFRVEAPCC